MDREDQPAPHHARARAGNKAAKPHPSNRQKPVPRRWTAQEDRALLKLVEDNASWCDIAKHMLRSRQDCMVRHRHLRPKPDCSEFMALANAHPEDDVNLIEEPEKILHHEENTSNLDNMEAHIDTIAARFIRAMDALELPEKGRYAVVAKALDVNRTYVRRWATGEKPIPQTRLEQFCRIFKVRLQFMTEGQEPVIEPMTDIARAIKEEMSGIELTLAHRKFICREHRVKIDVLRMLSDVMLNDKRPHIARVCAELADDIEIHFGVKEITGD